MRQLAVFTTWQGDPIAIRADHIWEVNIDYDLEEDGTLSDTPSGFICLTVAPGGDDNEITVRGSFGEVLQEIEGCLAGLEDWQRN